MPVHPIATPHRHRPPKQADLVAKYVQFASPSSNRARFVFGQIKNSLAAKIMKSLEYHMETVPVGRDKVKGKDVKPSS